jgi:hypothetical protein
VDEQRRERLAEIMAGLADGDGTAVYRLHAEFHRELSGVARALAASQGVPVLDPDELEGLVVELAVELAEVAGTWSPGGGALPWRWGARRLAAAVARVLGQHHRRLDDVPRATEAEGAPVLAADDEPPLATLARLAGRDERCALLLDAVSAALSDRDADVWLRYRQQQVQGDPSPARTVGHEVGLQPDAVRQIAARGRRRLRAVVEADGRYAPLVGCDLLAPHPRPAA